MIGTIKTPLQLHGGYMALFFFIISLFFLFYTFLPFCQQLTFITIPAIFANSWWLIGLKQQCLLIYQGGNR